MIEETLNLMQQELEKQRQAINNLVSLLTEKNKPENKLLSRKETAKRLNICLSTLDKMAKTGILQPIKTGRKILFNWVQVEQAIKQNNNEC